MKKIKPLLLYVFNFVDPRKKNYFGSDLLKKSVCYCSLKVIAKKVKKFYSSIEGEICKHRLKGRGVAVSKEGGAEEEEEEGKDKADTHSHSESTPLQEYLSFLASLFLLGFL